MCIGLLPSESVAATGDLDEFGILQEAIQNGRCGRNVSDQFAPVFQRSVTGHHGAAEFVATHDDLEEKLAALFRQMLHAHVVEDQQVWLEISVENPVMTFEGFVVQEVTDAIEDAAVVDREAIANQLSSDTLDDVTFASTILLHLWDFDVRRFLVAERFHGLDDRFVFREEVAAVFCIDRNGHSPVVNLP